jgi:hypothetical protein
VVGRPFGGALESGLTPLSFFFLSAAAAGERKQRKKAASSRRTPKRQSGVGPHSKIHRPKIRDGQLFFPQVGAASGKGNERKRRQAAALQSALPHNS